MTPEGAGGKPVVIVFVLLALFAAGGLYSALAVRRYTVRSEKLGAPARLAVVSDLHAQRYGSGMRPLIRAIEAEKPDLVIFTGDLFSNFDHDAPVEELLRGLGGRWPCYYVTGNHECWSGDEGFLRKMAMLEENGVKKLSGALETVTAGGARFNVGGVDDPDAKRVCCAMGGYDGFAAQLDRVREGAENGLFTVFVAHRPEMIGEYAAKGFDLILCGHAHGGQWRIPGLLNGVFAPGQGLFPRYAGGLYERVGSTMIVRRGLLQCARGLPRFYNRPELVIVDIAPEKKEREKGTP